MAKFGVTTALVSILLSVFMAGWARARGSPGRWVRRYGERIKIPPLRLYAICELLIGISALLVPLELAWGSRSAGANCRQRTVSSGAFLSCSREPGWRLP